MIVDVLADVDAAAHADVVRKTTVCADPESVPVPVREARVAVLADKFFRVGHPELALAEVLRLYVIEPASLLAGVGEPGIVRDGDAELVVLRWIEHGVLGHREVAVQLWLYLTFDRQTVNDLVLQVNVEVPQEVSVVLHGGVVEDHGQGLNVPKFTLLIGPQISPPEPLRSCALKFFTSQSGMKLLLLSVHVRLALLIDELKGWKRIVKSARLN